MNYHIDLHSARRGFTLIELLVVIAIIAILAAMGFGAGALAIDKARRVHALSDCSNLVQGIQAFYDDYNSLPDVPDAATPPGVKTEADLMDVLVGFEKGDEIQNSKGIRYYKGRDAKGSQSNAERAFGGLFITDAGEPSAELLDPWRKIGSENRHYYVMMDLDYDEELEDPFRTDKILYGRLAIAWCTGKDGKFSTSSEKDSTNRDNVHSWK